MFLHREQESTVIHSHAIHFYLAFFVPFSSVAAFAIVGALVDTTDTISPLLPGRVEEISLSIHRYSFYLVQSRSPVLNIMPVSVLHHYFCEVQDLVRATSGV